jgi:hypothetical protein
VRSGGTHHLPGSGEDARQSLREADVLTGRDGRSSPTVAALVMPCYRNLMAAARAGGAETGQEARIWAAIMPARAATAITERLI